MYVVAHSTDGQVNLHKVSAVNSTVVGAQSSEPSVKLAALNHNNRGSMTLTIIAEPMAAFTETEGILLDKRRKK